MLSNTAYHTPLGPRGGAPIRLPPMGWLNGAGPPKGRGPPKPPRGPPNEPAQVEQGELVHV